MSDVTGESLAGNIVRTVATAEAALAQFERALVQAGFSDNAEAYCRLADTLIAQRLWVESSGEPADARFRAVGARASAIRSLLEPYVGTFRRLSALAAPEFADADEVPVMVGAAADATTNAERLAAEGITARPVQGESQADTADDRIIDALNDAGRPMSLTALRAAVQIPRPAFLAALDRLAEAELVRRRHTGGRELIVRTTSYG